MALGKSPVRGLLAALSICVASGASAAVIDFTSAATGTSGMADGISWTMSATPVQGNNTQLYDGAGVPVGGLGLAFERDGAGVGNDEISFGETLTITFSAPVKFMAFAFLDLFKNARNAAIGEVGVMTINGVDYTATYDPLAPGGYAESFLPKGIIASSATFTVRKSNDKVGLADGAVAGLQFDALPIPVPASGLMLLGGVAGMAALRRRKRADV